MDGHLSILLFSEFNWVQSATLSFIAGSVFIGLSFSSVLVDVMFLGAGIFCNWQSKVLVERLIRL